jgi:hypothetical protein
MDKALKHQGRFLPAHAESAAVLQPSDGSLHRSAALVSAQFAAILSFVFWLPVGAMRRNHLHLHGGEFLVQGIRVIGFVANQFLGKVVTLTQKGVALLTQAYDTSKSTLFWDSL